MKKHFLKSALLISSFAATTTMLQAQSNNVTLGGGALNSNTTGSYNTAIGYYSLYSSTTAWYNTAIGYYALNANTGSHNTAVGYYSLSSNTTGIHNTALGVNSLLRNTSGIDNTAVGYYALYTNTTGYYNIALGMRSLSGNTTGRYNIGLGNSAGTNTASSSIANAAATYSIFIGQDTKAQADNQTNQIVIGYNAVGNGSNSVTLGGDAITKTVLKGNVGVGTANPAYKLDVAGVTSAIRAYIPYTGATSPINVMNIDVESFGTWTNAQNSNFIKMTDVGGNRTAFVVRGDGFVGINTATPNTTLDVNGIIHAKELRIDNTVYATNDLISSVVKQDDGVGGTLILEHPNKTATGQAYQWAIYNMTNQYGNSLQFWAYEQSGCAGMCESRFTITDAGNVGIGTMFPYYKLDVQGTLRAREVKINLNSGADFVFEKDYNLMPINELGKFVTENKHLPDIAPAAEMTAADTDLGEMQVKLLQKIEELTLYVIKLNTDIEELKKK